VHSVKYRLIPLLNQSAIFVGSVVGFLNPPRWTCVASSLPPRYHLWFRNGIIPDGNGDFNRSK